jgi:hypothetical protein
MNFKDQAIKEMHRALQSFLKCGYQDKGRGWIRCAPNDEDFVNGQKAILNAESEMPWLLKEA